MSQYQIELVQLVKSVNIRLLESGDKQGEIVLRTVDPRDCPALLLLATKSIIKVIYEYPETDGPIDPVELHSELESQASNGGE
jgi:hypothetical protein